jgi:2-keto-3-deoxy-6-phosphogluconate aldolase
VETARRCLDEGAAFLTTRLDLKTVEFADQHKVVICALTPTEVIMARKVVKSISMLTTRSGALYQSAPFTVPQMPLTASGGINQLNVADFIGAAATAVGVGAHLVPKKAIELREQ